MSYERLAYHCNRKVHFKILNGKYCFHTFKISHQSIAQINKFLGFDKVRIKGCFLFRRNKTEYLKLYLILLNPSDSKNFIISRQR